MTSFEVRKSVTADYWNALPSMYVIDIVILSRVLGNMKYEINIGIVHFEKKSIYIVSCLVCKKCQRVLTNVNTFLKFLVTDGTFCESRNDEKAAGDAGRLNQSFE